MGYRYPYALRLRKRWEFDAVFRAGRRERGELVRIFFLCGKDGDSRFGAVVSKKIANAVERARGRRLIRESLRRLVPHIPAGCWLVCSLTERGLTASAVDVYQDLIRSLYRRNLLLDDPPEWDRSDL